MNATLIICNFKIKKRHSIKTIQQFIIYMLLHKLQKFYYHHNHHYYHHQLHIQLLVLMHRDRNWPAYNGFATKLLGSCVPLLNRDIAVFSKHISRIPHATITQIAGSMQEPSETNQRNFMRRWPSNLNLSRLPTSNWLPNRYITVALCKPWQTGQSQVNLL